MKTKKNYLYFNKWWVPLLIYIGIFGIFLIGTFLKRNWITNLSFILSILNIIGSIMTIFISKGKWYFRILIFFSGIFVLLFTFILAYQTPDYYGANKKIPENIKIYDANEFSAKSSKYLNSNSGLRISGYGGSYSFHIKYSFREKGHFYLKAYEVTSNKRLSKKQLDKRLFKVETLEEKLYENWLKIYEGSQNYKYACRLELWFKPINNKNEYKITEQNFIITGWESSWF
ncbi:hypothetical protein [Winogradskyella flava]|uniref:Uncharacterized protein n=1 Tax=Winogradskyella flava TaxID=1884876 RepID=A0A842ITM1_9FLAO|nr:hypothetical protein [Winogradskyella flava]MBC2845224.1 hypothetical protein [Winogradskyella flava]